MGGLVCAIRRNAVLKFQAVPTSKGQVLAFDSQIRHLINAPGFAEAVAEDEAVGREVCEILAKKVFTHADRVRLLYVANEPYEDED